MTIDNELITQVMIGAIMALLGYKQVGPWMKQRRQGKATDEGNGKQGEVLPAPPDQFCLTKELHDELCGLRLESIKNTLAEVRTDVKALLHKQ